MPRDYKHRVQSASYNNSRRRQKKPGIIIWRWLLIAILIAGFLIFLNMIRKIAPELIVAKPASEQSATVQLTTPPPDATQKLLTTAQPDHKPIEAEEPRYDFYTILPQAEIVVPDYEIKTRVREELVGKTKAIKYVMQAGSFREAVEADHQKAKLALLGIEARVEKAKVGNVIWHRVKIGPYDNPSSVSTIKELLQKNGFGVIVTEGSQ